MRIGIDVGGTFTDLVAIDERGVATLAKVPTTPDDPSRGVLEGLARLADMLRYRRPICCARQIVSCTAPPSPPTRCSRARVRAPACW
jgi:N-methylhydantoinase A/oxoprolinase/acetone carboxylase beta subunit